MAPTAPPGVILASREIPGHIDGRSYRALVATTCNRIWHASAAGCSVDISEDWLNAIGISVDETGDWSRVDVMHGENRSDRIQLSQA